MLDSSIGFVWTCVGRPAFFDRLLCCCNRPYHKLSSNPGLFMIWRFPTHYRKGRKTDSDSESELLGSHTPGPGAAVACVCSACRKSVDSVTHAKRACIKAREDSWVPTGSAMQSASSKQK